MTGNQNMSEAASLATDSVTRMLLASDGSTTRLLQAITGQPLTVLVDMQNEVRVATLPEEVRAVLGLRDGDAVVERRSRLLTPDRSVVSVNHVVLDPVALAGNGAPSRTVPIGVQLREHQVPQFREALDSGNGVWPLEGASTPCAFKAYVIHDARGGRTYVHESFNPRVVRPCRHHGVGSQPR
ncbi:hypothetical protein [Streptomyces avermitilis]|uniref:hypothetical protein n=1 Tax=Streptomyces avermitilis TaxID=33903 RepID=UPI0037F52A99